MLQYQNVHVGNVQIGNISYYVHPQVVDIIETETPSFLPAKPVVYLTLGSHEVSVESVLTHLRTFGETDDVYSPEFGKNIVLRDVSGELDDSSLDSLRASMHFDAVVLSRSNPKEVLPPSGPYFLCGNRIHQAWRLYCDELDAFMVTLVPNQVLSPTKFSVLDSIAPNGVWRHVAVPSRLYHKTTAQKPLAGVRTTIKDCFHVEGTQTTLTSRAFMELYGAQEQTAEYVQKVISLGAIVVGKTRMTSFAGPDEPTHQWVDFICPTNPRGDRYQCPGGSSTGAAASLAGYEWLDHAIGADTIGSIRAPAVANGLFSLRPSHGTASLLGIQPSCLRYDVVGLMSRKISSLHQFASLTLDLQDCCQFPTKILYPTDIAWTKNPDQISLIESFVSVLENFLGVKRTRFSFAEKWDETRPDVAEGKSLNAYIDQCAFEPMCHEYSQLFKGFRLGYKTTFGRNPYINQVIKFRWDLGDSVSPEEVEERWERQGVFRTWASQHLLASHPETKSDAILVLPFGPDAPKYRDDLNQLPLRPTLLEFIQGLLSPVLQIPQLVIPIGQLPYDSRISGKTEYRPIVCTLLGAKGSDLMLANLVKAALESASWPTEVQVGRDTFKPGEDTSRLSDAIRAHKI